MENPPIRTKPILERRGRTMRSNKTFLCGIFFFAVGNGEVESGARMALRCGFREIRRRTAPMAAKILKGMKPIDIPSQLPLSHRLTVNLKTARRLGMTINPHLLSLAHRVIE
jgi:putative ABC transport system substrate-binding protein